MDDVPIHTIKLGGSLIGMPDLVERLGRFVGSCVGQRRVLLVGGGRAANLIRHYDCTYAMSKRTGHWLAVRAMQLNTHLLAALLPRSHIVIDVDSCDIAWQSDELALVDPLVWLENDEAAGVRIPQCWSFTSDSIAAHVATRLRAQRLTLLKSTVPVGACDVSRAARLAVVDADFEQASALLRAIDLVNLRQCPPQRCVLR